MRCVRIGVSTRRRDEMCEQSQGRGRWRYRTLIAFQPGLSKGAEVSAVGNEGSARRSQDMNSDGHSCKRWEQDTARRIEEYHETTTNLKILSAITRPSRRA